MPKFNWLARAVLPLLKRAQDAELRADQMEAQLQIAREDLHDLETRFDLLKASTSRRWATDAEVKPATWLNGPLYPLVAPRPGVTFTVLDDTYWLWPKEKFQAVVDAWAAQRPEFVQGRSDCTLFFLYFKAFAHHFYGLNQVGAVIDHGATHAYNLVVWPDGTFDWLEPLGPNWVTLGASPLYKFERAEFWI